MIIRVQSIMGIWVQESYYTRVEYLSMGKHGYMSTMLPCTLVIVPMNVDSGIHNRPPAVPRQPTKKRRETRPKI